MRMIPSLEPVRMVSSSNLIKASTDSGCPARRSFMSLKYPQENILIIPLWVPQSTFLPSFMSATDKSSSSWFSLLAISFPFLSSNTPNVPSPLVDSKRFGFLTHKKSEIKSVCPSSCRTASFSLTSQSLMRPSSSPVTNVYASTWAIFPIPDSCAPCTLLFSLPVFLSLIRRLQSAEPLTRDSIASRNSTDRQESSWALSIWKPSVSTKSIPSLDSLAFAITRKSHSVQFKVSLLSFLLGRAFAGPGRPIKVSCGHGLTSLSSADASPRRTRPQVQPPPFDLPCRRRRP
mmetsp:Transcript_4136/g.26130  ORF Transcript_4136/g.26130 Transcript_4136/m.26130 type:complete len:289 (-) Transcript_4136:112-978(-)